MSDNGGLKDKKIRELEGEIAQLKGEVVITEGDFKGSPILKFFGPFRPFSLGVRKCRAILKSIDKIMAFVKKYDKAYNKMINDSFENRYKQTDSMALELGDFYDRCFPKTYKYFKLNDLEKKYEDKCGNEVLNLDFVNFPNLFFGSTGSFDITDKSV